MAGSLTTCGQERLCCTGSDRLLVEVHQTELFHRSKHSARFGSPEDSAIWLCNLIIKRSSSKNPAVPLPRGPQVANESFLICK